MTYGDVEAFLAILRNGSITAAAEALFITQPALSRKLKSLEQELGVRLFEREQGRHYLTLTAKGQEFAPLAEKWMSLHRETEYYKSGDAQATLKIGAMDSIHTYLLPPVLQAQLRLHPEVRLSLRWCMTGRRTVRSPSASVTWPLWTPSTMPLTSVPPPCFETGCWWSAARLSPQTVSLPPP